jgi:diadenylate cyclase
MSFLNFTFLDLLDILIAALLLYQLYRLVKGTAAIRIFIGITAVYLTWKLVDAFHMEVLTEILGQFIGIGFYFWSSFFNKRLGAFC